VLWALWQHYASTATRLRVGSTHLVVPAADDGLLIDTRNGFADASWDLWEERWGIHAFTVGAVWGGLDAARNFADLFGDVKAYVRYRDAADRLRKGIRPPPVQPRTGPLRPAIAVEDDGT